MTSLSVLFHIRQQLPFVTGKYLIIFLILSDKDNAGGPAYFQPMMGRAFRDCRGPLYCQFKL
ncbi:hypothetical protein BaRGS_00021700, partial [Batillaria attramentaria]